MNEAISVVASWIQLLILIFLFIMLYNWMFGKKKYGGGGYKKLNRFFSGTDAATVKKGKKKYGSTETKCREILERIFNKPFPSIRPEFLKNPITKKNLEIDMFNSELKLAIEYNGAQHYKYTPLFHSNINDFERQKARDDWKQSVCKLYGISFISIPYTVKVDNLEEYLRGELKRIGYRV